MIFKIIIDQKNARHVHFRLFTGQKPGALAMTGRIIMLCDEYENFKNALRFGVVGHGSKHTLIEEGPDERVYEER